MGVSEYEAFNEMNETEARTFVLNAIESGTVLSGEIWEDVVDTYGWLGEPVKRIADKPNRVIFVFSLGERRYSLRLNKHSLPLALAYYYEWPDQAAKEIVS